VRTAQKHRRKKLKIGFLLLALCVLAYVAYVAISITIYGNKSELAPADAAIVLGAAVDGDQPSPVFQERINHAIWLYQKGYADKLIFTGGRSAEDRLSEAGAARRVALDQGVSPDDIFLEERSHITEENLDGAKWLMAHHHLKSALLVSDPLHMKRATLIARDRKMTVYPSPTPTTRYRSWKAKFPFLCREVFFYIGFEIKSLFA